MRDYLIKFFDEFSYEKSDAEFLLSVYDNIINNLLKWCDEIEKSKTKLPEYKKVAVTYRAWFIPIANSFIINPTTKSRISNGFIEGKNNFVKVVKRVGFGY